LNAFSNREAAMKLVVAYEGTNAGERALALAGSRAKLFQAKVYVVTSLVGGNDSPLEVIEDAKQNLEHAGSILDDLGVTNETHLLVRGMTAGEDIVQFAEEVGANEIVLGIRRRSKVGKLLFGSTAQHIILNAPCPVVTTR
jgi:nucleotide-binding universal stress UspA family protein